MSPEGLLPRKRHRMLQSILELEDMSVDDVMVPHNEIRGYRPQRTNGQEIISEIRSSSLYAFAGVSGQHRSCDRHTGFATTDS